MEYIYIYIYTGYTDDICHLAEGKCPNIVSGPMHCALHTVETWCDKGELSVNLNESELIVFTREENCLVSLNHIFWGVIYFTLCWSSISG